MERVTCQKCGATFEKKGSRKKGYKVTVLGVLCDGCFAEMIRTTPYEFGCAKEFYGGYDGQEFAVEQMFQTNKLWNALVEIDRNDRVEYRKLTSDPILEAELTAKKEALKALDVTTQKQKVTERTRRIKIPPELTAAKKQLGQECNVLYAKLKAERDRMKTVNQQAIEQLKSAAEEKTKAALKLGAQTLPWTIIGPLKVRFGTASSLAKKAKTLLRFKRFDGTGIITVPYTHGISLSKLYRNDEVGNFQIARELMTTHPRERRTLCRIVVALKPKKMWLTLPVIFHRPLLPDANIRSVTVVRETLAGTARWKLVITTRTVNEYKPASTVACGIDIGWRKMPDGSVRVAYLVDQAGRTEELVIAASDVEQFRKLDSLKGIMETNFNQVRDKLVTGFKQETAEIPEILQPFVQYMAKWKSPARLVKMMRVWAVNRFAGDEAMWNDVQFWYHGAEVKPDPLCNGHQHLYSYWIHLKDQLHRKRREQYRVFAASLGNRYGTVFLEDFDLRKVAATPEPEKDVEYDDEARYQRTKGATSTLRSAIHNVCVRTGVIYDDTIDPKDTTHECPECGAYMDFDAAVNLLCTCGSCGRVFDQDFVGAKNVLLRGLRAAADPRPRVL